MRLFKQYGQVILLNTSVNDMHVNVRFKYLSA